MAKFQRRWGCCRRRYRAITIGITRKHIVIVKVAHLWPPKLSDGYPGGETLRPGYRRRACRAKAMTRIPAGGQFLHSAARSPLESARFNDTLNYPRTHASRKRAFHANEKKTLFRN